MRTHTSLEEIGAPRPAANYQRNTTKKDTWSKVGDPNTPWAVGPANCSKKGVTGEDAYKPRGDRGPQAGGQLSKKYNEKRHMEQGRRS